MQQVAPSGSKYVKRARMPIVAKALVARLGSKLIGPWALLLSLLLMLAASIAAPDFDKTQALALQRYGTRAANTVAAWRLMMERPSSSET